MQIDLEKFKQLANDRFLSVQPHPKLDLLIWNYTQKCQFDRVWTEETLMSRGLITDLEGNIVQRPFKKFFNLSEEPEADLPAEDFEVTEKMDGSLGILYWEGNKPCLATRGSFISEQAIKGTQILTEKYGMVKFDSKLTYLFEIIYPENRIVVDYGDMQDLTLLAVIDTETGKERLLEDFKGLGVPLVKVYDGIKDIKNLNKLQEDNREGFVIRFASGLRFKVKFDEYVRLHRLVTMVNAKTIWELLMNNQDFEELLERVPDEFYTWVRKTKADLEGKFLEIEAEASKSLQEVKDMQTRKDQALYLKDKSKYPSIVFTMLDDKDYKTQIWKMIRPVAEKPFKEEI